MPTGPSSSKFALRSAEADKALKPEKRLRREPKLVGDKPAASKPLVTGVEERLDEALIETFPASDPIAVSTA